MRAPNGQGEKRLGRRSSDVSACAWRRSRERGGYSERSAARDGDLGEWCSDFEETSLMKVCCFAVKRLPRVKRMKEVEIRVLLC